QLMNYATSVKNLVAKDSDGKKLDVTRFNNNTWKLGTHKGPLTIAYDLETEKQFVANSYVDSAHAYIVSAGAFLYIPNHLNIPVTVTIQNPWRDVATGLDADANNKNIFTAPDFDILYDCPILLGDLETF